MASFIYLTISLTMLVASAYFVVRGKRNAEYEVIASRLAGVSPVEQSDRRIKWLEMQFYRAGINFDKNKFAVIAIAFFFIVMILALMAGLVVASIFLAFSLLAVYLVLTFMYVRRQQKIISQLPRFLDQVVRSMHTGKTLGDSVFNAIDASEAPLQDLLIRVKRNVTLGVSFPDAFQEMADTYDMKELQVLAMGVRVNFRYGGSMTDLLNNLIHFIREREKFSRQLRAMTGETRVSAVVLALVPTGIAAYILSRNPHYMMTMWSDPTGRNMMILALVLQIVGILIMWRMLKSI